MYQESRADKQILEGDDKEGSSLAMNDYAFFPNSPEDRS